MNRIVVLSFTALAAILPLFSAKSFWSSGNASMSMLCVILSLLNVVCFIWHLTRFRNQDISKVHLDVVEQIQEERLREIRLKRLKSSEPFPKDVEEFKEYCKETVELKEVMVRSWTLVLKKRLGFKISDEELINSIFSYSLWTPEGVGEMLYEESDVYQEIDFSKDREKTLTAMEEESLKWFLTNIVDRRVKMSNGTYLVWSGSRFHAEDAKGNKVNISEGLGIYHLSAYSKRYEEFLRGVEI